MSAINENNCSKCGLFSKLVPANISRKTGERLYRTWCFSCEKQRKAKWVQDNIDYVLQKTLAYQRARPEQTRQYKQKWADNNKEYTREYSRQKKKQFPEQSRADTSARRRKLREHRPIWETHKRLKAFYLACPKGYHVDHIIPLHGKLVSGLHVVENLQYLPAVDNLKKSNKYVVNV